MKRITPLCRSAALAVVLAAVNACGPADKSEDTAQTPPAAETSQAPDTAAGADAAARSRLDRLKAEAPRGRLPDTARPRAYTLDMKIDPREPEFSGKVKIAVELRETAAGIWLHGNGITVSMAEVTTSDGTTMPATYDQVLPSGVSRVGFGKELPAGAIHLTFVYTAPFDTTLAGLFRVEEQGEAYALAKSESVQARKYLPGFDEPGLKASYTISLTVPEGYGAISNGRELSREPAGEGYEKVRFETTRPISTYLLSLAAGPFDVVEGDPLPANDIRDHAVPLRGIARKGRGGDLNYVLELTPAFVEIFEKALGVPYPYKKLDIVAAPQWPSGATELAGAVTYREQLILVGDAPAPGARRSLMSTHAHELAHSWFGNLVTPPWWDDLWLKEGFASWGVPVVLMQVEPKGGHGLDAIRSALRAMRTDSLASARSVREPIDTNEDIRNAYTAIPYSKGMAVIRMVENYFGVDRFRRALGRYVDTHKDGAANSPQFFETIGEVSGEAALTEAFRSFVEQPGVPLIDAALDCSGETPALRLAQSRYKPAGSRIGEGGKPARWVVPMCVAYERDGERHRSCTLLQKRETRHELPAGACPAWVMPNAGGTGYYRWSLTKPGWDRLTAAFHSLAPTEALAVVDSAVAAFESGTLSATAVLAILEKAGTSPVRQVAEGPLDVLERYVHILEGQAGVDAIEAFGRRLYGPRIAALVDPKTEDERLLKTRLEAFLALSADDPQIRKRLAKRAARFIGLDGDADASALNSDQYVAALTVGVQDLGAPFFDRLIEVRATIDDPRFDGASAEALGQTRAPELARRARDYALSGKPGPREAFAIIAGQMSGVETREATWSWIKKNFEPVSRVIPAQWRRRLPTLAADLCDTTRIGEVRKVFETHAELVPGHERPLKQTVERIELCAAFKAEIVTDLRGAL